jgi:hypothetical protein
MTTDRDLTRALRSWLHEDAHEDADRVLDLLLDEVDRTPQRRGPWFAGRRPLVRAALAVGLGAAAVVAVVIGLQLLPGANVGGPPHETPTVSPTATASIRATPTALPASTFPPSGDLAKGSQSMTRWGVPFTFDVPVDGWTSDGGFWLSKSAGVTPDGASMLFWNLPAVNVYSDPCAWTTRAPPAGPSAGELANAMASVPGTDLVSGPADVTVGGYAATLVVIKIRDDIGCTPTSFYLWYSQGAGSACGGAGECGRYASGRGSTISVWIIDVRGTRIVIEGETYAGAGPGPGQEIQHIVDSITFA